MHKPFERELSDLGVAYPAVVAPVIVAYPVQEPDSLFLHLIVAHEIGHSAITEHRLAQQVWAGDPDPAPTQRLVGAAVSDYVNVEAVSVPVAVAKIGAIIRSWFSECVCDALALALLGPSFLFTMATFGTPFGGPEPSETHPPFTLRTKLMLDCLDAWGWNTRLDESVPVTAEWIRETARQGQEAGTRTYFNHIRDVMERTSPTLISVVEKHLDSARFSVAMFDEVADELDALLEHDILPAQLGNKNAADRRGVVLAGWLHAFRQYGDAPASLPKIVGDRRYQRFLTKALEMSAVLDRWGAS